MDGFTLIGYSIRKTYKKKNKDKKIYSMNVTMDSECPRSLEIKYTGPTSRFHSDGFNDIYHTFTNIVSKYEQLKKVEKKKFTIFSFAVEKNSLEEYHVFFDFNQVKNDFKMGEEIPIEYKSEFCGYDVLDVESDMGISIINHCGIKWYTSEKIELNKYNLFSDYLIAKRFAGKRLEEKLTHSPCAVWAIWRIQKVN